MKAAVLHEANQPLTIEEVADRQAGAARGAAAHRLRRAVPQRPALHGGAVSDADCPSCSATRPPRVVEAVGAEVTYVKPGDHVITCLSVFCGDCAQCVTGHTNLCENTEVKTAARRGAAADAEGQVAEPGVQPVVLCRADAGARARHGEDPRGHPAGPRRAGRLRRDDRGRRGVPRREGRAGRDRRGDRLRRHRAVGGQRRGARRRRADHRDRYGRVEAGAREADGRHRHDQRSERRPGRGGEGDDRRRRAIFVRGDRHQEDRRAVVRDAARRAAWRRSSA